MKKGQCKDALEIYKRFLTRMTRVSEFLKVAEVSNTKLCWEYNLKITRVSGVNDRIYNWQDILPQSQCVRVGSDRRSHVIQLFSGLYCALAHPSQCPSVFKLKFHG